MLDDLSTSGGLLGDDATAPDDQGALRFRRVRDLGGVINVTFRFLSETWRELGMGLLVIVGPVAVLAALASVVLQNQMLGTMAGLGQVDPNDPFALFGQFFTPAYFAVLLFGFLAPLLVTAVTLAYVRLYRAGEAGAITPGFLWAETRTTLGPVLTTTLALVGLGILSIVVALIPCLGLLAGFAFWIYLVPIVSLLYVVRTLEGDGLAEGVRRVRSLIEGRWAPSFGTVFVAGVIVFIIAMVFSIPSSMVSFGWTMNTLSGEPPGSGTRVLMAVGAVLGTFVYATYVIPVLAAAFLYGSLAERAESTELHAAVEAIGLTPRPEDTVMDPPLRAQPDDDASLSSWRPSSDDAPPSSSSGFRGGGFDEDGDEPGRPG
ncbi:MAG: hypothetical protein HKN04_12335 [Rhodothermaceae bacterium]|nr:hypothetical protein [Rhodothermaceae bacterium]